MAHKQIKKNGFTLVEMLIAVAIVGILAAIAIPSYQESVRKTRRADAEGALLAFANAMERHYTVNNTYCETGPAFSSAAVAAANTCAPGGGNDIGLAAGNGFIYIPPSNTSTYYEISIAAATATTYTLLADPIGDQAPDRCGNLTLTSVGAKGFDAPGTAMECWKN